MILKTSLLGSLHSLGSPAVEKTEQFLGIVALALFKETGVLDVEHTAIGIEHHKYGNSATLGVAQTLHKASAPAVGFFDDTAEALSVAPPCFFTCGSVGLPWPVACQPEAEEADLRGL